MDKKLFEQRLRQLSAVDKNAVEIYSGLAKIAVDKDMKAGLIFLAADEEKHLRIEEEIFKMLEK